MVKYRKKRWNVLNTQIRDSELRQQMAPDEEEGKGYLFTLQHLRSERWRLYHEWRADWLATYNAALSCCRNVDAKGAFKAAKTFARLHANDLHGVLPQVPE